MALRLLGIDPGLTHLGWGVIEAQGSHLRFIACGVVRPAAKDTMPQRLLTLADALAALVTEYAPEQAALEETFVTANGTSTLKLGQARGAIMLALAQQGLPVYEYAATQVKKTIAGQGRADKEQMARMVEMLLPAARERLADCRHDAADALAVALCHSQLMKLRALQEAAG